MSPAQSSLEVKSKIGGCGLCLSSKPKNIELQKSTTIQKSNKYFSNFKKNKKNIEAPKFQTELRVLQKSTESMIELCVSENRNLFRNLKKKLFNI
jgi:hypothetical protein